MTMTTLNLIQLPTINEVPQYDEVFTVLLEEQDEFVWKMLLQEVSPQFSNPIAAQIAHIMKSQMAGESVGELVRKMLYDKAMVNSTEEEYLEEEDIYDYDTEDDIIDATKKGHAKLVKILLDKGGEVNEYNSAGETALDIAELNGNKEIEDLLKHYGAETSAEIWWNEEKECLLSKLTPESFDRLNKMPEDERNETLDWLTKNKLMNEPIEPIEPTYTCGRKKNQYI